MRHIAILAGFTFLVLAASALDAQQPLPRDAPVMVLDERSPAILWRAKVPRACASNIAVSPSKVLVGSITDSRSPSVSAPATLVCISRRDGKRVWEAIHPRLPSRVNDTPTWPIACSPCVVDDRVFYTTNRGELVCVDLEGFADGEDDGPEKSAADHKPHDADYVWKLDMVRDLGVFKRAAPDGGNPTSSPLVHDGVVYCVTGHGRRSLDAAIDASAPSFVGVDVASGRVVWSDASASGDVIFSQWSSPTLSADRNVLLFPGGDGKIHGFSSATRQRLWVVDCLSISGGDRTRARRDWPFYVPPLAIDGQRVYLAMNQGRTRWSDKRFPVHCFEMDPNAHYLLRHRWTFNDEQLTGTVGPIAIGAGAAYVVGDDGHLFALHSESGILLWKVDLLAYPSYYSGPTLYDGKLLVATEDRLFVFRSSAERPECVMQLEYRGEQIWGTPVVRDDVLYVGVGDSLLAIDFSAIE